MQLVWNTLLSLLFNIYSSNCHVSYAGTVFHTTSQDQCFNMICTMLSLLGLCFPPKHKSLYASWTLVTINRNLDATVTQNQIPVSGHFSFKDERVWSVIAEMYPLKTCNGETSEELQNFAPLPSTDSAYYRHVVCTFEHGKMMHSSTVRSPRCLGRAGADGLCVECMKVRLLLERQNRRYLRGKTQRLSTTTPHPWRVEKERLVGALRDSRVPVRKMESRMPAVENKYNLRPIKGQGENYRKLFSGTQYCPHFLYGWPFYIY